ncbi:G-alpha-domain-containing protein [Laetiporus sulphureus 93-53]|uniref:G-alpha-domain-containing protein n=1 Tax=Laetiporus sulphureus 93-53 TaxID=1314785 RepID=A0A165C5C8_9APHY|nr:G-alpha-domain-containing protein [Laetiporus sulphureus 93-53]KZT02234.1 G-alpha-domain-containing protein [Laetiporus sulphureus 93-53]
MANHRAQLAPPSGRRRSLSDPLAAALLPPPNESPEQRDRRLRAEEEAKKRSDHIDRMIKENEKERRRKKIVKVLLLGQSESGKSTTLKQFQLLHTPAAFHAERIAWRFVIYLNLVRSIRRILEAISPEPETAPGLDDYDDMDYLEPAAIIISSNGRPSSAVAGASVPGYDSYRRQLAPLRDLEQRLIQQLSDPEDNESRQAIRLPCPPYNGHGHSPSLSVPSSARLTGDAARPLPRISIPPGSSVSGGTHGASSSPVALSPGHEIAVHSTSNWRKAFALGRNQSPKSAHGGELQGWWEDPHDPVHVLNRCAPVMIDLWRDPKVRQRLAEKRLRLEESSGFYLDEIERVTAKMYFPTDDDVLKARLKTNGVVEHTFSLPKTSEYRGVEWKIYDVGGARPQRQAWAPYFDDVNAIIFLAPISAFDQVLAEDPRVNRLEDSFELWKLVVSNPLLSTVNIILFLNKCDLLKKKLENGVRLNQHMPSYKDRPNDYDSVSKYFRLKFGAMHHTFTPNKSRECYIHLTSVTDTRKTQTIISNGKWFRDAP